MVTQSLIRRLVCGQGSKGRVQIDTIFFFASHIHPSRSLNYFTSYGIGSWGTWVLRGGTNLSYQPFVLGHQGTQGIDSSPMPRMADLTA